MTTVAKQIAEILAAARIKRIYGIVGDSLNGLTDAIRKMKNVAASCATLVIGGLGSGAVAQTPSSQATSVDLNKSTQAEIARALSTAPPDVARGATLCGRVHHMLTYTLWDHHRGAKTMSIIMTSDGIKIIHHNWGKALIGMTTMSLFHAQSRCAGESYPA